MLALLLKLGVILCTAVKVSSQSTVSVVAGNSIEITCDLGPLVEAPFWFINNIVYELLDIPRHFPSITLNNFVSLALINSTENFNNTLFMCATFKQNGSIWRINIYSRNTTDSVGDTTTALTMNNLIFDYRKLDIQINETTLGWTVENICNDEFGLEGFILNSSSVSQSVIYDAFIIDEATNATIPSKNLTSDDLPVLYRLVAFGEDGSICSNKESQTAFYRFDASEYRDTIVLAPNSTSCYDIPETEICSISIIFVLQSQEMETAAFCPIHNSSFGQFAFESCIDTAGINIAEPYFSNGAVCFRDKNSNINGTFFHFLCSTAPCSDDCFVRTILSSYVIIIAGPPSEPDVSYNGDSLCFCTSTYEEFPVDTFSVAVTDVTGISTDVTGIYNVSSAMLCLSITSDPPNVCWPLSVVASASNEIGTSPLTQITFSGHQDNCDCYQLREQVYANVSEVLAESAIVKITCQREETVTKEYFLEDLSEERSISFECGESKNLTDLAPNTNYTLVRRYSDEIQCILTTFTTGHTAQRPREEVFIEDAIVISIGVTTGLFVVFVAIVIFFLVIIVRGRRTGRGNIQSKSD